METTDPEEKMPTNEIPLEALVAVSGLLPSADTIDVTIERIGVDVGDQLHVDRRPWLGLIYDPAAHAIEISVGAQGGAAFVSRHMVHRPERVWVESRDGTVDSVNIEVADGPDTMLRFHRRPALDVEKGSAPLHHL
jgi:hypothetical protein